MKSLKIFSCEGVLWAGVNIIALVPIIIVALNEQFDKYREGIRTTRFFSSLLVKLEDSGNTLWQICNKML